MKVATLRRFLQPAAEVRHPFAVPTILAFLGIGALLFVALLGGNDTYWAIPVLLCVAAITSFFASLASAGVRFERAFPSLRTAFFGIVSVATLFLAVVMLCLPAFDALMLRERTYVNAFVASLRAMQLADGSVGTLMWKAAADMDAAVSQWAKDEREAQSSSVKGWLHERPWYRRAFAVDTPALRGLAEKRLAQFAGSGPAWASTARLCEERSLPGYRFTWDYNPAAVRAAQDYSFLLGREIKPADLLPRVPGGRCE